MDSTLPGFAMEADLTLKSLALIANPAVAPNLKSRLRLSESQKTLLSTRTRRLKAEQRLVQAVFEALGEAGYKSLFHGRSLNDSWTLFKKARKDEHIALAQLFDELET